MTRRAPRARAPLVPPAGPWHAGPMGTVSLCVVFDAPGWFAVDASLALALDGSLIYEGSLGRGFDVSGPVAAGPHVLETAISLGLVARRRRYDFAIEAAGAYRGPAAAYVARLAYSRVWGNFTKRLELSRA